MKVPKSIKKYKAVKWFNRAKRSIVFGIDVVMEDGKSYHVLDDRGPMFFRNEEKSKAKARELNKQFKTENNL